MDDTLSGTRNKRGEWKPNEPLSGVAPIYAMPPQPLRVLRWLPEYLLPWNLAFAVSGLAWWLFLTPPLETLETLDWRWILPMYAVNAAAVFLFYGAFELRLYITRAQGNRFKYNPKFPADEKSDVFWFGNQVTESILRTFLSGVTVWTLVQALCLWVFANGWVPWLPWTDNWVWLAVLTVLVPVIHEGHFYLVHRLIHVPVLYRWIHSVHHNSVNPTPWSSLSMHTVEHILYFAVGFYYLLIPSHPFILLFALHRAGFGAIPGHVGFDKVELGAGGMDTHAYGHYLHHKYFEVNYGDGIVPLDAVFGTWHDGTEEGERRMKERFRKKKERMKAATPAS
ncbi:sterol desaturase family protein [Silicimonas algicola]|uniref:Sterol desaturase/sphingolipid hydroxylase (Fatty acid hydroxylase superfamily) n=1 Tax=Silicimonas algicola TaxID=1826607 RepID=A0A316GAY5_9RHOB|nr:sterol desaturase family protein [Silicimonas algicola]AZQ68161.1 sterol desaturase family protein [Silicimonas algicola]PWK57375.1 sterol desaturase/sphingolipid hydroxylase (fatty acid hydroxylase superfamily) [Silicimonas algicola]